MINIYPWFYPPSPGQELSQPVSSSAIPVPSTSSGSSEPQSLRSSVMNAIINFLSITFSGREGDSPIRNPPQPAFGDGAAPNSQILASPDCTTPPVSLQHTIVPAPIKRPSEPRIPDNPPVPKWETFDEPEGRSIPHDPCVSAVEAEKALRALFAGAVTGPEETDIDMSEAVVPGFRDGIVLLPHQVVGRKWMRERETGTKTGGILADDMGLGKTIQTLTRIVDGRANDSDHLDGWAASTLVVCPVSLISQWAAEISRMAVGLRVIEHHGSSRTTDPLELQRAHIVITSYMLVLSEFKAFGSDAKNGIKRTRNSRDALFRVKWFRIVLDEAHAIKNRNTKSAAACCALEGKFRWCLTGTPMQNNIGELYSLIKFLRIQPLDDWETFDRQIAKPVKEKRPTRALKRLHVVLGAIMLRRTKNRMPNSESLLRLPERNLELVECSFSATEKEFYRMLEHRVDSQVNKLIRSEQVGYMHMLVLLLRLRQACNHPLLVLKDYHIDEDAIGSKAAKDDEEGADELAAGFGPLDMLSVKKCQLCRTVLPAGHDATHCKGCQPLAAGLAKTIGSKVHSNLPPESTKIKKILGILRMIDERSDGVEKTIVFSQFTTMLDLIEPFLDAQGIKYTRYDGSMAKYKREASLEKIRNSKSTRCILISLMAGGTGLNLTACNNVILVDTWWNAALEDRAYDRVHRLGQTRDVNIYKLIVPDTIETRILKLQETKRKLTTAALSSDRIENKKLSLHDLLALFGGGGRYDDDWM